VQSSSILIRGSPLRYDPRTLWQPAGLSRQSGGMELVIKKERGRHEKMSKLQAAPLVRFYVLLSCSYSLFIGG